MSIEEIEIKQKPPEADPVNDADLAGIGAEEVTVSDSDEAEPQPQFVKARERAHFRTHRRGVWKKRFRVALIVLFLIGLAAGAWFVEPIRLWKVNAIGLRAKLMVTVGVLGDDKRSAARLKNATVSVNGREYKTDDNGSVAIADQPYGDVTVVASKSGYESAQITQKLPFDPFFHSNPAKIELSLKSVGVSLSFKAVSWLSDKPITSGQFRVGDIKASADEQGVVSLKAPPSDSGKVTVHSDLAGAFIDKTFELALGSKEVTTIAFVPAGRDYFVSRRDGASSVYSSNLDGTDVQLVVPGTGQETTAMAFGVAPSGQYGVLASSRDGARSDKGDLLQRLYVVDLATKRLTKVDEGLGFSFADWAGGKLVYVRQNVTTDSAAQVSVRSMDTTAAKVADVEANIYSVDKMIVGYQQAILSETVLIKSSPVVSQQKLVSVDLRGSAKVELAQTTTNFAQTNFDAVTFQTSPDQIWYEVNLNTGKRKVTSRPANIGMRTFLSTASPDGLRRMVIDQVDGKFALITKTTTEGAEKQLYSAGGLQGPIRWVGNTIVFRVVSDNQSADYVLSPDAGEPKKITDVTATVGGENSGSFRYY